MLGLGWTEMLVIGVVALIFIGPKDLPVVMNRAGKILGQIRRMGSEFQREINKSTGLDEVRNLRTSITAPLKKTTDEIRKEFNTMTPTGPKPSGAIKPADPKSESVVDEIKAAAGMTPPKTADQIAAESGFKPAGPAPKAPKASVVAEPPTPEPVKAARKTPARAKAAPTAPETTTELPPVDPAPVEAREPAAPRKKVAPRPETPVAVASEPAKPAPRKRAPAKTKASDAPASAGSK